MQRIVDGTKVKFVFSDEDFEMRLAFEEAMNAENHWKQIISFIIEKSQDKTMAANTQWALIREHLKKTFQKDWPKGPSTIAYSHPDRSFTITMSERYDSSSDKNRGGKK